MSHGADSTKSIHYALAANASIAIAKSGAAIITGSGSMAAEAIHSFADTCNQLLLLLGLKRAKLPPSPDFPLGYGRETYFWSFIVALMLFSVGGMFSVYEGWHKFQHPEALSYPLVAIGVLLFGIVAEGFSMWGCMREVDKVRDGRSYLQWFRESRQSELLVIFGEDFAALLGLVFALVAISATMVTGNPVFDAIGSMVIGILLIAVATMIGREVKAQLIGESAEPQVRADMRAFLENRAEIKQLFNLLTVQLGDRVMVAVKAEMTITESAKEMVLAINASEKAFKEEFPQTLWLFFEPDLED